MKQKEVEQLEDDLWDKDPDPAMLNILRENYNHPLTIDQVCFDIFYFQIFNFKF